MEVNRIICGDSMEVLRSFEANCIDTVITDPPYGLSYYSERVVRDVLSYWLSGREDYIPKRKGFMGKSWDAFVPSPALWREVKRVMKPGGTILVFSGARVQDLMMLSLRLAGFKIRDVVMWLYGEGFPKGVNVGLGIDKIKGVKFQVGAKKSDNLALMGGNYSRIAREAVTDEGKDWFGYHSHNLKPAYEPIILAMKDNEGSYAQNALNWKLSGLNIDASRISVEGEERGRYPTNVLLDEKAAELLDEQGKYTKSTISKPSGKPIYGSLSYHSSSTRSTILKGYSDEGGPSRFFYVAKTKRKERKVVDEYGRQVLVNYHPTVKPYKLIEYLVRMTKMPNSDQVYLDPFFGSGTLGVVCKRLGCNWIGIEKNPEYCGIAEARIKNANGLLFADGGSDE